MIHQGAAPKEALSESRKPTEAGATAVYCPDVEVMYSPDTSTHVIEDTLSKVLCGKSRPFHFRGVTTVVTKLFNACLPDRAYFGRKDYQQLQVIRRMVRDMDMPLDVIGCPIIREPDGLAMSSRNRYLNPDERTSALKINQGLSIVEELFAGGETDPRVLELNVRSILENDELIRIDYVECRDSETLDSIKTIERSAVVAVAVNIGNTRLIDNIILRKN